MARVTPVGIPLLEARTTRHGLQIARQFGCLDWEAVPGWKSRCEMHVLSFEVHWPPLGLP